ncbi:hypothetical protein VTI74DRAFT_187 [Chaetomium olivicolor]
MNTMASNITKTDYTEAANMAKWSSCHGINGLARLEVLAEVASRMPYLPVSDRSDVLGTVPLSTITPARETVAAGDAGNKIRHDEVTRPNNNSADDTDSAESTIEVQPLSKKPKLSPSVTADRNLASKSSTTRSTKTRAADNDTSPAIAALDTTTSTLPVPSLRASSDTPSTMQATPSPFAVTATEPDNAPNAKCTACEAAGPHTKCRVVKSEMYKGACLRCIFRDEKEECSLFEGAIKKARGLRRMVTNLKSGFAEKWWVGQGGKKTGQ